MVVNNIAFTSLCNIIVLHYSAVSCYFHAILVYLYRFSLALHVFCSIKLYKIKELYNFWRLGVHMTS
jgi:hypothetical protein